jgi:hypothetical protein
MAQGSGGRLDLRQGASWDGGEMVLGQHGDVGNPIWALGRGHAHRQALSVVALMGSGATLCGKPE